MHKKQYLWNKFLFNCSVPQLKLKNLINSRMNQSETSESQLFDYQGFISVNVSPRSDKETVALPAKMENQYGAALINLFLATLFAHNLMGARSGLL